MNINGKWYTETELAAYVAELEKKVQELEEKHWSECRQISEYDGDLKWLSKELDEERDKIMKQENPTFPYALGYMDALKEIKRRLDHRNKANDMKDFLDKIRGRNNDGDLNE